MSDAGASLLSQGFTVVPEVIDPGACSTIARHLDSAPSAGAGSRRLLRYDWCQKLAWGLRACPSLRKLLSEDAVAVQCTLFDKTPTKNWLVALHQDRSIPVLERVAATGLTGWSEKEGDIFVQPPTPVLEQLTAVRVHIDACPVESGALRVVPGSHVLGVLKSAEADALRSRAGEIAVPAPRGGALVMKPLILHASSKATSGAARRVLHFVFGPRHLPFGLQWQHAI